jgi:ribosomal protein L11 methyltransferase
VHAEFHSAADAVHQPARIVVANILAHPLIVLAPLLARLTARHGRLALAGVLTGQTGEVCAAYHPWFDFEAPEEEGGWALLSGIRR